MASKTLINSVAVLAWAGKLNLNIMNQVNNWWSRITARWADWRLRKLNKSLRRNSNDAIQLMEFNGEMYICHLGTPIVSATRLNADAVTVVRESREVWIDYKLREMDVQSHDTFDDCEFPEDF